jgi:hypothetical protein
MGIDLLVKLIEFKLFTNVTYFCNCAPCLNGMSKGDEARCKSCAPCLKGDEARCKS